MSGRSASIWPNLTNVGPRSSIVIRMRSGVVCTVFCAFLLRRREKRVWEKQLAERVLGQNAQNLQGAAKLEDGCEDVHYFSWLFLVQGSVQFLERPVQPLDPRRSALRIRPGALPCRIPVGRNVRTPASAAVRPGAPRRRPERLRPAARRSGDRRSFYGR